ncbi:MAG: DUF2256 domain-containing protein [Pseudomonadota bacterium]
MSKANKIPKGFKNHLPTKTCPVCGRLFAWRKRWRLTWEKVLYCSERCQRSKGRRKED